MARRETSPEPAQDKAKTGGSRKLSYKESRELAELPDKIAALFDKWPEAVALGEKMDFVPVAMGDERSHAVEGEL